MRKFLVLFITFFIFQGCMVSQSKKIKNISFQVLDSGSYSNVADESIKLVNDQKEFDLLFSKIYGTDIKVPFDYSIECSYIFIFFKEQASGGLNYKVTNVTQNNDSINIYLDIVKNDDIPSISTMAISHPFIVLKIGKSQANDINVLLTND